MENKTKLVKVYSSNSKKSRLKRNKNKFQRVWDEEKQTYIKVRKAKYPIRQTPNKAEENIEAKMAAIKRRQTTVKKPKSVPVNATQMNQMLEKPHKPVLKQPARKEQPVVHGKVTTINFFGTRLTWDEKTMKYKKAAL